MRHKDKISGFTLTEILIVVIIIGLLATMALPNFTSARQSSRQSTCLNNLRQIASAKDQWAVETGQTDVATPGVTDVDPYIRGGSVSLICPSDPAKSFTTSYNINPLGTNPSCQNDPGGSYAHVL